MKTKLVYKDRVEAGEVLADQLQRIPVLMPWIVLSLPRGGTIVGAAIAARLGAVHDLIITRKIGAPSNPEVAVGAVTQEGEFLPNEHLIARLCVPSDYITREVNKGQAEIERRLTVLRGVKPFPDIGGKTAILVDDGLATGSTMEAAIRSVRLKKPYQVIIAVPVGPTEVLRAMEAKVDRMVCPLASDDFWAVGDYYQSFPQVSDDEVRQALKKTTGD